MSLRTFAFFLILAFPLAPQVARAEPPPETAAPSLVDINTASVEELMRLPGIGPAKAQAIVEYRSKRRFASPAAIQRVSGIGKATYLRIRDRITVGNR